MPRLRILAGPSLGELTLIAANSNQAVDIKSDAFEGKVAAYIEGFVGASGELSDNAYFKKRPSVSWSIQVQGAQRFNVPHMVMFIAQSLHRQVPQTILGR